MERRIEAEQPVERLTLLGGELGLGPEHDLDDVAGDETHQHEHEEGDAQERGNQQPQATEDVPAQSALAALGLPTLTCRATRAGAPTRGTYTGFARSP